jgi:hypothetical protein
MFSQEGIMPMDKPVSNMRAARVAGLLYLIVVGAGIFSLAYVPSQISVIGDPASVVHNIMASETLFRTGILAGLVCFTAFLLLPFALYRLLGHIDRTAAVLMVAFAVASVPISFVNMLHRIDVLSLLSGAEHLRGFTADQLNAQVMMALKAYGNGLLVSKIFWGLWLLPFGYLVFRSRIIPRIFGVLLMMGCFGYLIDFTGQLLFPDYREMRIARLVSLPRTFGEIGICLWLLIMGAREVPLGRADPV